jgi:hypothetical protein
MTITRQTITETGCYLDNHRGHYLTRDVVELAIGYGFIVGEFERFALDQYEDHNHQNGYPHEALTDLADEARAWLNAGQLDRVTGQNFPPIIPADHAWDWFDGDFGLYSFDDLSD